MFEQNDPDRQVPRGGLGMVQSCPSAAVVVNLRPRTTAAVVNSGHTGTCILRSLFQKQQVGSPNLLGCFTVKTRMIPFTVVPVDVFRDVLRQTPSFPSAQPHTTLNNANQLTVTLFRRYLVRGLNLNRESGLIRQSF